MIGSGVSPQSISSAISKNRELMRTAIAAFPGAPFAVVDGGLMEDLPRLFGRERLFARSLYLDQVDREVQKAGPWLVALNQSPKAAEFVLALPATKPFATFWSCAAGEAMLYRHLRTLTLACIPEWAAEGGTAPLDPKGLEKARTVFFRFFDPRTLGALMPVLDAAQFSRVLGPAEEIAFEIPGKGGLRRVIADRRWPAALPGMLTIRSEQIHALNERRVITSRQNIAAYLRYVAPEETRNIDDDELYKFVSESEKSACDVGLESEQSLGRWAYLMLKTNGRAADRAHAADFAAYALGRPLRDAKHLGG